jgi:hypothetical protein
VNQVRFSGVGSGEVVAALVVILGVYSDVGGLLIAGNMLFGLALAHRAAKSNGSSEQHSTWRLVIQRFLPKLTQFCDPLRAQYALNNQGLSIPHQSRLRAQ